MAAEANRQIANMNGNLAIPRQNGEPLFQAPWEARAFSIAVVLNEKHVYPWRDFSQSLAAEIAQADARGTDSTYYERWYAALEKLVTAAGLVSQDEIDQRTAEYAAGLHDDHHDHHDPHHHARRAP